ncbi:MAG: histidine phosphatase family protein [Candidatus Levyibacteriota bacterium]
MTRLIFITHPVVEIDPSKPADQWLVSKDGWKDVKRLLKKSFWSQVDKIYSSQENKAKRVAEEIAENFGNLHFNTPITLLGEIDRSSTGFLERETYDKAIEEFYRYPDKSFKGWETSRAATERIVAVVSEIMKENKDKTIAIVGHGATGTLLACHVKGIPPTIKEDPRVNGCIMVYDWDKKQILSPWEKY